MKQPALIVITALIVGSTSSYVLAQQDTETMSPQERAYDHCEILANEDESENAWNTVFSACMTDQGFGDYGADASDITPDDSLPDESYIDDNYLADQ